MDDKLVVGWWEWVHLPQTGSGRFRAKIDTGARSSAMHAHDLRTEWQGGTEYALFHLTHDPAEQEQRFAVIGTRTVRSSNGVEEARPTIRVTMSLGPLTVPVAVTLTDRLQMKYRMLVGRESLAGRVLVDPGRSHVLGKKVYR